MKTLAPGITAEETSDKGIVRSVFWPKTGMVMFILFFSVYVYLMYGFTPKGPYAHTFRWGEALLFYLMFLGLFSPMLYLALTMWVNQTIIEISKDRLVMRYRIPYWFGKKITLGPEVRGFRFHQTEFYYKGVKRYIFTLLVLENGKETKFTDFFFREEGIQISDFLNRNLQRLRGGAPPGYVLGERAGG
jgi:hypothetical protein